MNCQLCAARQDAYRYVAGNQHAFAVIIKEPMMEGHCLVMPRRHVGSFNDLGAEESLALHHLVEQLRERLDQRLQASTIIALNGGSYRTQQHLHYHLLPVKSGLRTVLAAHLKVPERVAATREELRYMAELLR